MSTRVYKVKLSVTLWTCFSAILAFSFQVFVHMMAIDDNLSTFMAHDTFEGTFLFAMLCFF